MAVIAEEVEVMLGEVRAMMAFQGRLGLEGVDLPDGLLRHRVFSQADAPGARLVDEGWPDSLSELNQRLEGCERCKLSSGRTHIVFGVGNVDARLMFVGEGPGRDEDLQGEPFVGAAGQLLTKIIVSGMGMRRSDVYIANIVKCRPPRNRDPDAEEVEACEPFLKEQIRMVQPEVIVALGRCAAQALLRESTPISRLRGKWAQYEGIALMPTYHPAYLLRNPSAKRAVWEDIQEVIKVLKISNG